MSTLHEHAANFVFARKFAADFANKRSTTRKYQRIAQGSLGGFMDQARRNFLQSSLALGAGALAARSVASAPLENGQENIQMPPSMKMEDDKLHLHPKLTHHLAPTGAGYLPVVTMDVPDLSF